MNFVKIFGQVVKNINTVRKKEIQAIKHLRGSNIFETYLNVESFEKINKLHKKMNSKKCREILADDRKKLANSVKGSLEYQQQELKNAEQVLAEAKVKYKENKGKRVSILERKRAKSPTFRHAEKFILTNTARAGLGVAVCNEEIRKAKEELGTGAMLEEIAKTSLMFTLGFGTLRKGRQIAKTVGKTATVYLNKGETLLNASVSAATIGATLGVKPLMDSIWTTQYEKKKSNS